MNTVTLDLDELQRFFENSGGITNPIEGIKEYLDHTNKLRLEKISFLLGKTFLVESYQRGYRWTKLEVLDFLQDIDEFIDEDEGFYCLQPVVVKRNKDDGSWELIDGQQRVTTICLILNFLDNFKCRFNISYRTRKDRSDKFLEKCLPLIGKEEEWASFVHNDISLNTIDNYHFFCAWKEIQNWFREKDQDYRMRFRNTLLEKTKIIWSDADDTEGLSSSIAVFSRLNSGKIPLRNSELIKATFIMALESQDEQFKFVQEWDEIEHSFRRDNDELWYFINPRASQNDSTRIDFLFNIAIGKTDANQEESTFRYYQNLLKACANRKDTVNAEWEKIRNIFFKIEEWHEDTNLYHYIGYLINTRFCTIVQLLNKNKSLTKKMFLEDVKGLIRENLQKACAGKSWDELLYTTNSEKETISKILLLFNIETIVTTSNDKSMKFPFKAYAGKIWSLEHIHAQNSENDKRVREVEKSGDWLENIYSFLKSNSIWKDSSTTLSDEIESALEQKKTKGKIEGFDALVQKIDSFFSNAITEDELHVISNMALLDKDLNAGLSNSYFADKRKKIIAYDKEGKFIPIATKNVFYKYYSETVSDFDIWSSQDRSAYLSCINKLLGGVFIDELKLGEQK